MVTERLGVKRTVVIVAAVALAAGSALISHPVRAAPQDPPPCTIVGTEGDNALEGTLNRDVVCGLGGNDIVKGLGGDDLLMGGPGADKLFGGQGSDALDGGYGVDAAHFNDSTVGIEASLVTGSATGAGDDTLTSVENLTGSPKADSLTGSDSQNVLSGKGGGDILSGLSGEDKLTGGTDDDTLRGGTEADEITSNGGADDLFGDAGEDRLDSRDGINGNDALDGGSETDDCLVDAREASTTDCEILPDFEPPSVMSVTPGNGARGIARGTNVTVFFSEAMKAETVSAGTVKLFKANARSATRARVSYDPTAGSAVLNPNRNLSGKTKYKVVVTTGARDLADNALDQAPALQGNQQKVSYFITR